MDAEHWDLAHLPPPQDPRSGGPGGPLRVAAELAEAAVEHGGGRGWEAVPLVVPSRALAEAYGGFMINGWEEDMGPEEGEPLERARWALSRRGSVGSFL